MSAESFMRPGVVDLSALKARTDTAPSGATTSSSGVVRDVTEATFQAEVLQQSMSVPVVIDFWAEWCGPCKQLSPTLERLASEYGGRFVLAKIDVDANQALAASAQVQSIPMVMGVIKGQPVPLFAGALPEAEVRRYIDELLRVAAANGVSGTFTPAAGGEESDQPVEPPHDPRFDKAYDAIERGDFDAAVAAYEELLAESPADADAKAGLAQASLLKRTASIDPAAAQAAAQAAPDDVDAQLLVADLEVAAGRAEAAFDRLVATVRATAGEDRDQVRARMLELFDVVGQADPRVAKARAALASALF